MCARVRLLQRLAIMQRASRLTRTTGSRTRRARKASPICVTCSCRRGRGAHSLPGLSPIATGCQLGIVTLTSSAPVHRVPPQPRSARPWHRNHPCCRLHSHFSAIMHPMWCASLVAGAECAAWQHALQSSAAQLAELDANRPEAQPHALGCAPTLHKPTVAHHCAVRRLCARSFACHHSRSLPQRRRAHERHRRCAAPDRRRHAGCA